VRRKGRQGCHSMPMQQAGRVAVDVSAAEEGASLATSRWCRSRDCRRRVTSGCCCPWYCCRSHCSCLSPSLSPYPCRCCWGWGQKGERPSEDMSVPAVVGVEKVDAAEDVLLLRVRSRTRRPVPRPSSCPARSPQV
jgi:hypothetical protein